jgi:hypothetical protein
LGGKMVNGIIDILVGFIIGIIENSSWFQNLFANKLYNSLIQGANKKVKDSDDTLESFYRELYQRRKNLLYALIDVLIIDAIVIFVIAGIVIALLNAFTLPLKIGNIIIPQWALFVIGYVLSLVYYMIKAKIKSKINYSNFL